MATHMQPCMCFCRKCDVAIISRFSFHSILEKLICTIKFRRQLQQGAILTPLGFLTVMGPLNKGLVQNPSRNFLSQQQLETNCLRE